MVWQGLDEFLMVVERGSFTAAADALDVSTSHISRQITQLETRLGTVLLKRSTRKISITDAGRQFAFNVKEIKQALIDSTNALQGENQIPKGLIKISGAGSFMAKKVAPVLATFLQQYPEVELEIDFNNRFVDLVEEGYDLAVRFGRLKDSNLIARPLCSREMSLVATPDYVKQHPPLKNPIDLQQHNCLTAMSNKWRFVESGQTVEVKIQSSWRSNNGDAILQACFANLGIAHLAKDLVEDYVKAGQLVYLLDEFQVKDNATYLVYPRKDIMPHRVRLLIDYLLSHFQK